MSKNAWMVRAGEGGHLIEEFAKGTVTVGWPEAGEIKDASQRELRVRLQSVYPQSKPGAVQNAASVLWRFAREMKDGDIAVTYHPKERIYLLGEIQSGYVFIAKRSGGHPHVRKVHWHTKVSRDLLSVSTRNTLGSTLTLFLIPPDAVADLEQAAAHPTAAENLTGTWSDQQAEIKEANRSAEEEALELLKDRLLSLDPYEMQDLVAAILRAMGYRTRVSPPGPDRGLDVFASPDGLGLQEPRIKVEVKHRESRMASKEIRSFLGSLRTGDKGLYISTGGFSREAKYEADRANIPVTLVDVSDLAQLVTDHYENFDAKGRALIPLVRIYRPAE